MWRRFTVCAAAVIWIAPGCATFSEEIVPQQSYPTLEEDPVDVEPRRTEERSGAPSRYDASAYVPSDVDIGDPRDVQALSVRVHVRGGYRLPSAPNHVVETLPFELQTVRIEARPGAEVTDDERREALRIDERVDADHDALSAKAQSIVEYAGSDRERVDLLVRWVYGHVRYTHTSEEVASAVLDSAEGDCTEYSLLFVAMARAVGLPARRVVGLAFTYEAKQPAFGYHAWAEVEIDGRWVQVDPTWNETTADASHIKLDEGDSTRWHRAAGNIELWVLDVERAPGAGAVDPSRVAAELPAYLRLRR